MRVHVVSDVHGRIEALRRAGDGADALICLGDLLLFLDYADSSQGIFADLFGPAATAEYIALRTDQRFDEAREFSARLWSAVPGARRDIMDQAITAQYARIFAAMPTPAYLTYGNVDVPAMWGAHLRPGHHVLDGECAQIGGLRFGFGCGRAASR